MCFSIHSDTIQGQYVSKIAWEIMVNPRGRRTLAPPTPNSLLSPNSIPPRQDTLDPQDNSFNERSMLIAS